MNEKRLAVDNIAKYGDTDIFPYPIENALFFDMPEKVCALLERIESDFKGYISKYPVEKLSTCIPVGPTGFRWATQIDPIWNAYLLYLVISISKKIESKRIPTSRDTVFSYRLAPDPKTGKLFSEAGNWRSFVETSIQLAEDKVCSHVIRLDISDFYTHILHHRLENMLDRTGGDGNHVNQIKAILQDLSGNNSYGLPIGGNAARILAELLLTSIDNFLVSKRIRFCRFVDDFVIVSPSKEEAFRHLNVIAEFLLQNENLSIQRTKTQVMTSSEYITQANHLLSGSDDDAPTKKRARFLNLKIFFDPYSATAEEDYKSLKGKLSKFDITGLLIEEVRKSRIHQALGRQLLNAVQYLEDKELSLAFKTIMANCDAFYPIFPSVLRLAAKCLEKVPPEDREEFVASVSALIDKDSYIVQNDNTRAYAVRALSRSESVEAEQAIDKVFTSSTSPLVRANCIYAMTNRRCEYWLSNLRSRFVTMSRQERRAFIAASYVLGDEGKHWRDHTKEQFLEFEVLVRDWVAAKTNKSRNWRLPI